MVALERSTRSTLDRESRRAPWKRWSDTNQLRKLAVAVGYRICRVEAPRPDSVKMTHFEAMRLCCLCTLMRDSGKTSRKSLEETPLGARPRLRLGLGTMRNLNRIPTTRCTAISIRCVHKCPRASPIPVRCPACSTTRGIVCETKQGERAAQDPTENTAYPRYL